MSSLPSHFMPNKSRNPKWRWGFPPTIICNDDADDYHSPSEILECDGFDLTSSSSENYGAFFDKTGTGILGQVKLQGLTNGSVVHLHLSNGHIKLDSKEKPYGRTLVPGGSSLWISRSPKSQPQTWYKTSREWGKAKRGSMVKASDVIGLLILLQLTVAQIIVTKNHV